jgi:hypothetical protein
MRLTIRSVAMAIGAVLVMGAGSFAQDASPTTPEPAPLAYQAYVTALDAFSAADPSSELGPSPAVHEVLDALDVLLRQAQTEYVRLGAVVPEACYSTAHEALLDYWLAKIELYEIMLPGLAGAEALSAIGAAGDAMHEELRALHPTAYVMSPDPASGFRGSYENILTALATCAPVISGQRLTVPEARLAIRHPNHWSANVVMEEVNTVLSTVLLLTSEDRGVCALQELVSPGVSPTLDDMYQVVPELWFATSGLADDYSTETVSLPVGDVVRATFDDVRGDPDNLTYRSAVYLIPAVNRALLIHCAARPELGLSAEDDWLAIAQSLELLPAAE